LTSIQINVSIKSKKWISSDLDLIGGEREQEEFVPHLCRISTDFYEEGFDVKILDNITLGPKAIGPTPKHFHLERLSTLHE
jgi:hypothetical protein